MKSDSIAVIGAGPYGLSVAAHLHAQGVPTQVFGKTMEFWDSMPAGWRLRSSAKASTLVAADGEHRLDRYAEARWGVLSEPIPAARFAEYGRWFERQVVTGVDQTYVTRVRRAGEHFHLELHDGRMVTAGRVVVATGVADFAHVPAFARSLPVALASHVQAHHDLANFRGKRVAVLGRGQSPVQIAALLLDAGAEVELLTRRPLLWERGGLWRGSRAQAWMCWLGSSPALTPYLPAVLRTRLDRGATRPDCAWWLRPEIEGRLRITTGVEIADATACGNGLALALTDGSKRHVDHLILGTGYRLDVAKLPFLDAAALQAVRQQAGYPLLDGGFESTLPGLHFAGPLASFSHGPACRFIVGAGTAARSIARRAADHRSAHVQMAWSLGMPFSAAAIGEQSSGLTR